MKIALGQINTKVGDFDGNVDRIQTATIEARAHGADIIVFPELTLSGYPCKDIVDFEEFRKKNEDALERLKKFSNTMDILIVVGALRYNYGNVYNSAYALYHGETLLNYDKTLLPTYDVFDEWRNFTPGDRFHGVNFMGRRIGLTICEDIWYNRNFTKRHNIDDHYTVDVVHQLKRDCCDLILNLSASPFTLHKLEVRHDLLKTIATEHGVDVVYCNMVGGNDSLVFDGNSMAYNREGKLYASGKSFKEDLVWVNFDNPLDNSSVAQITEELPQVWSALVLGVRDYVSKCGFEDVVVGLSGGIDSAVVTAIAAEALEPEHVVCITMPSQYSSEGSVSDSVELSRSHGIKLHQVPIQSIKDMFEQEMSDDHGFLEGITPLGMNLTGLADENIQARIRGTILMAYSNQTRALVLSTGNKSETAVGYCTLYGDMCGGLSVIADVPKTTVYALARWYNQLHDKHGTGKRIPDNIITKAPSAELAPGQFDQQSLPPYEVLDAIILKYVEERKSLESIVSELLSEGVAEILSFDEYKQQSLERVKKLSDDVYLAEDGDPKTHVFYETRELLIEVVRKVLRLIDRAEYKRQQAAPTLKVTTKAWAGRFIPIAKRSLYA